MQAAQQGLAVVRKNSDRFYEAKLWRIQGELTLQQDATQQARSESRGCFLQALTVARQQNARSLELRAALSLARLWQPDKQKKLANTLLVDVSNKFTEGFETPDLRESAILLEELADG